MLDALDHDHPLEAIFVETDEARAACGAAAAQGIPVYDLAPGTLAKVTDTVSPQGMAAIAPMPQSDDQLTARVLAAGGAVLVLVGVADPGNAGTLLRIAEAAGVGGVLFCDEAVDPFAPKCVRASAGSIFHVPVMSGLRAVDELHTVARHGGRRIGASARRGAPHHAVDLRGPVAVVLGSEAHGLPAEVEALVDEWTHVPMAGHVESLNVAVTGALVLFERQRGTAT